MAQDRSRPKPLSVLFSETMTGVVLPGAGPRPTPDATLSGGAALSIHIRVKIPDLDRFERFNSTLGKVVAGSVYWDGRLAESTLERNGTIRLVRDGRIAGISRVAFKVRAIVADGSRMTFLVRRTLDPLGKPYDSSVDVRVGSKLVGRGVIFDPPRAYDQHITDVSIEGAKTGLQRKRGLQRFMKAVRAAPRRAIDPLPPAELDHLVGTLLEFLHVQEDGGPTRDDVHAQYKEILERVPEWRKQTIIEFLRENVGALRFFRGATRLLIRDPMSRVVNTVGLDAAHNLYQFLYYTLERANGVIGHTPMPLAEGTRRRPQLRRPNVERLDDLDRPSPRGALVDGFDVVIIGSGPAGSLLAKRLSRHRKVLVIEKGPAVAEGAARGSENAEFEAYTRLYEGAGLQAANDDWGELNKQHGSIFILQGACVGGGGMVNNSICVRMSEDRIRRWVEDAKFPIGEIGALAGGGDGPLDLRAAYAVVGEELGVQPMSAALAPGAPTNPVSDRLKVARGTLPSRRRPRSGRAEGLRELLLAKEGCVGCGFCNVGCAYGAKRSAYEVYLRAALDDPRHDLTVVSDAEVTDIVLERGRVAELKVAVPDGPKKTRTVTVRGGEYILAAGAVGSSLLMQKSPSFRDLPVYPDIGTRFSANIAVPLIAVYKDDAIREAPRGLQMTHSFVPPRGEDLDGYVIETWFSEPGGFALGVPGYFAEHRKNMKRYRRSATAVVLVGTDPSLGSVHWYEPDATWVSPKLASYGIQHDRRRNSHPHKRPHIVLETRQRGSDGELTDAAVRLRDSLRNGLRTLARQMLRGADGTLDHILVPSRHGWVIRDDGDVNRVLGGHADLDEKEPPFWPGLLRDIRSLRMTSAHPQGGNPLSTSRGGVVGPDFRLRGVKNLRVCDASIFPDNAGVNPQWTVLALAHLCSLQMARELRQAN